MKLIAFACLIGIIAAEQVALDAVKNVKDGIVAFDAVVKDYAQMAKLHVPLEDFTKDHKGFSAESGKLVGDLVTLLLTVDRVFSKSTQSINGMCTESESYLEGYVGLFESYSQSNADSQKDLLVTVLTTASAKLVEAKTAIQETVTTFNAAHVKLSDLLPKLKVEFDDKSELLQFFLAFQTKMVEAGKLDFASVDGKVNGKIEAINSSLASVKKDGVYVTGKEVDEVKNSANEVIAFLKQRSAN